MKALTLGRRGSLVLLIVSMLLLAGCSNGDDGVTAAVPDAQKSNILFIGIAVGLPTITATLPAAMVRWIRKTWSSGLNSVSGT